MSGKQAHLGADFPRAEVDDLSEARAICTRDTKSEGELACFSVQIFTLQTPIGNETSDGERITGPGRMTVQVESECSSSDQWSWNVTNTCLRSSRSMRTGVALGGAGPAARPESISLRALSE